MNSKNKGSALILILITMFLITTLGLAILSVSMMNLEMKSVDGKSKENFYSAETALDEIEVGLEELVTTQIKEAYKKVLENYSSIHPTQRVDKFREYLRDNLCATLTDLIDPTLSSEKLRNLLDSYVIQTPKYSDSTKVGVQINEPSAVQPYTLLHDTYAIIHDVYVVYKEKGYETVIQTDIKMEYPKDLLFDDSNSSDEKYVISNYAIIADKGLEIAQNNTTSLTNIVGNIYAGDHGISMANYGTMVNISAADVITRGDIAVKDKARLYINGNGTNRIWAKNLRCELSNGIEAFSDTAMDIHGHCYIYNDLLLNAKRSNVKLHGTYTGYGTNQSKDIENGSAILVNGKDSKLDLSEVSNLIVAGNASIDIPSYDNAGNKTSDYIMTGDSITMKGNQIAYLVPEACISAGHNPVLWSEYSKGVSVDITKAIDIKLSDYVNMTHDGEVGYRKVFFKMVGGMNVVYYYLEFNDEKKANDYMVRYNEVHPQSLDNIRMAFPVSEMNFVTALTKSNGITTRIKTNSDKTEIIDTRVNRSLLDSINSITASKYLWMTQRLTTTQDNKPYLDKNSLANSFVDMNKIKLNAGGVVGTNVYTTATLDTYSIQIIYNGKGKYAVAGEEIGNEVVVNTPTRGILIATGDVNIKANFTGLVIAGGNITVSSNASIYSDATIVNDIWNRGDENINQYFYDIVAEGIIGGGTGSDLESQTIDISNLISYQNWHKN
jgi:hypothetical protein